MKRMLVALLLLACPWLATPAQAQSSGLVVQVCGTLPLAYKPGAQGVISLDINGNQCIAGTFSQTGGTVSNATSGVATSATNQGSVSWNYGFNGTTWDQLQVDASKFLKVNCAAGCTAGTGSNATSGQATSSTNGQVLAWLYGFNGATWDQLQVDGSKNLKVTIPTTTTVSITGTPAVTVSGTAAVTQSTSPWIVGGNVSNASSAVATSSTNTGTVAYNYGFNGTTWDQLQVDGSKFLKVNCSAGCATGTVSNATSGVATSSTNLGTVAYNYGFNGTTWDQLQVDGSKNLKVVETNSAAMLAALQAPIAGVTQAQTSAAASSLVAKASAGSLVSVSGSAVSGSFIMIFNSTTAPADGAVTPVKCFGPMAAAGPFVFGWGPGPVLTMSTGITIVSSSTGCFTKTATNAAFIAAEYQ